MNGLRILTWHVHGSYLNYLTHTPHQFFLPVNAERGEGYGGRTSGFDWGDNVHEIPADAVKFGDFDVVLYQSHKNWLVDRHLVLGRAQQELPQIYLEHDPPRKVPTDTRHPVNDPNVLVVHCTHFNALMWDCGRSPTAVIDHGVPNLGHRYRGELEKGLVVVNGLRQRGRRLGADIFMRARQSVPLDLLGMGSEELGGLGDRPSRELPDLAARYRFFFHPIRYTSLGLALLEAMMLGMPIVGLATTELPTVIRNGENGFIATDERQLVEAMQLLIAEPALARKLGTEARLTALDRFNIDRFAADWSALFLRVAGKPLRKAA